ncbi:MAG: hypothetical protein NZ772_14830, partial [Cyanobacteria bacterium]|nr:hypothetical protein [Cyanobacteriota bacterium]MDW8202655.1 hypothetical protein [Cyanobacteriota bacterium SKYGB_h_bin112]
MNTIPTLTAVTMVALVAPAMAHTTVVSGQVAGTWHVDPDHSPKAGEPARIWVALTRRGGTPIAFDRCACKLLIYPIPGDQPLLTPELRAISAEQYRDI